MKRLGLIGAASLALLAGPALARAEPTTPTADPIGDVLSGLAAEQGMDDDAAEAAAPSDVLIGGEAAETADSAETEAAESEVVETADGDAEDPAETAAPAPAAAPYSPQPPFIPPPPVSRLPQLDRPVMIDELWRTPEAPPTVSEQAYESRIRGGAGSAQGLQGPLDGGWVLRGPDGRTLYGLQLVDRSTGTLEGGAFRSLRQDRPPGQAGLIESADRMADGSVQLRFTPRGSRQPAVLTLRPTAGGWTGELWEGGATRPVTMGRQ
ncbi:MAG TPA: hypothetical protein VEA44_01070 [Caulobacter sp.]|nr:hypothetical protein [Caulobacter sp.]